MPHGFIRDMLDVKILILYVLSYAEAPVTADKIYAFCFQDDTLSYFDVMQALPELAASGHVEEFNGLYAITPKGREHCAFTIDSIAKPVLDRAKQAVQSFNAAFRNSAEISGSVVTYAPGTYTAKLAIDLDHAPILRLELSAPSGEQAEKLVAAFRKNPNRIYAAVLHAVLQEAEEKNS